MNEKIKKNILDLNFQKYLIIASTSAVIAFTYLVGFGIALMTAQVNFNNFLIVSIFFGISLITLCSCSLVFYHSLFHLRNIIESIKLLKI